MPAAAHPCLDRLRVRVRIARLHRLPAPLFLPVKTKCTKLIAPSFVIDVLSTKKACSPVAPTLQLWIGIRHQFPVRAIISPTPFQSDFHFKTSINHSSAHNNPISFSPNFSNKF
jgi:hypothetical protein